MISGIGSAQYLNNSCTNTGGLTSLQTQSYYSEGLEVNASANITVDGLQLISSVVSPPIQIGKHAENFTLRNITVEGVAGGHCMGFETPLRNFSLDGAAFSNCGKLGIHQNNIEPSGNAEDEALTFRNVAITSVGTDIPSAGLHIRTPMSGLVLHNVSVAGSTSHGVRFDKSVEDSSFSNLTISDVSGHGIYLGSDTRNVSLTQIDINHAGADCIFLGGTPAPTVSHRQTSITESTLTDCAGRGIATAQGLSVRDLEISDNYIDGVDGNGIAVSLAGTQSENVELVQNVLRNFGRNADGDAYSGIKLTGASSGTMISQNTLHDENDQATFGIYHDVPGSHPSYLCTNPCIGTLHPTECLHETSDPAYQTDSDLDGTVDACEDDDADGVYGQDDNCQGQPNPLQTDSDLDGIGDACDNCVFEPNPAQADFNSDAEGDLCDLDDGLIYVRFPDRDSLNWQLEQEFSRWNIYRGDLTLLLTEGAYTQRPGSNPLAARRCRRSAPPWHDARPPSPGQVAFYLITGVQGLTESDLGHDSSGQLRPNAFPCLATASRP